MTEDRIAAREAAQRTLQAWEERLVALSREIHADPELAFDEHRAAARVAGVLRAAGLRTTAGAYGLPTAVEAVAGDGEFTVTLCAEYDALPGIGHACGHNIIAAAGVGAAVALAPLVDALGIRLKLLGTPAEEHGGGKAVMLASGAWEDSTVSLMVHGAPGADISCADIRSQAVDRFDVTFTGRAAHAAGEPELGVNAGNAATIALVAIGLLRQHLPEGIRLNAFVAEAGEATNVIAASALVRVEVRSPDLDLLRDGKRRVLACFEGGAVATGCGWSWRDAEPLYANVVQDPDLAAAWDRNVAATGRTVTRRPGARAGSTDMGNVSQVVPAIHPMIGVLGVTGMPHTEQFRLDAATPAADRAALDGAAALAGTVIDIVTDPALRAAFLARQRSREPGATTRPLVDVRRP
ncbi:M20 family metallopeptidase [Dactylosporangium sp. CA-092794]|uniref:M20 family metallopeptidase n=1 Tax=Dactylosporangium sp. CA-092794 TaxID=3239929 RepID=UPI003D924ED1